MAKRKKTLRATMKNKKKSNPTITRFTCPVCKNENVVVCRILKKEKLGIADCSVCEARHECFASNVSKAIDVYSDWIDNCEL